MYAAASARRWPADRAGSTATAWLLRLVLRRRRCPVRLSAQQPRPASATTTSAADGSPTTAAAIWPPSASATLTEYSDVPLAKLVVPQMGSISQYLEPSAGAVPPR